MLMMHKVFPNLDAKNNNNRKIAILFLKNKVIPRGLSNLEVRLVQVSQELQNVILLKNIKHHHKHFELF
jgi:hypothetical protein